MPEIKPTTDAERFRRAAQIVVSAPKAEVDRRAAAERKKRQAARKLARA
jgi:hypothetical protein